MRGYIYVFSIAALMLAVYGWREGSLPATIVFGAVCTYCIWRLASGLILLRQVRDRGWRITWTDFLFDFGDLARVRIPHVPSREDWLTLPASRETRSEIENLHAAIALAKGQAAAFPHDSEPVCIYHAPNPEMAHLIKDILIEEGFAAQVEETMGAAYRVEYGGKVYVPAEDAAAAKRVLEERLKEQG